MGKLVEEDHSLISIMHDCMCDYTVSDPTHSSPSRG